MPTIFTKFVPRTDQLPARVKAWTQTRGEAAYITHESRKSVIENHATACDKLARKLHWNDCHFVGAPLGYGFAFVPCDVMEAHTHTLTGHHYDGDAREETTTPEFNPSEEARATAADMAFSTALAAAGIAQPFIDTLLAYSPTMLRDKYELGLIQFQSPATEEAFREALNTWAASSAHEDHHPLMTSYGTHP